VSFARCGAQKRSENLEPVLRAVERKMLNGVKKPPLEAGAQSYKA
jgi:hypothetical protein